MNARSAVPPGAPGPAVMPPGGPTSRKPSLGPAITCIVLGIIGIPVAGIVVVLPYLMFALAGGGDPGFDLDAFFAGFLWAALVVLVLSVAVLVIGIVLAVRTGRRRRTWWQHYGQVDPT